MGDLVHRDLPTPRARIILIGKIDSQFRLFILIGKITP